MQRVAVRLRPDAPDVRFTFLGEGRHDLVFLQEPLDADDDNCGPLVQTCFLRSSVTACLEFLNPAT